MQISLALAQRCDAILVLGDSPATGREREVFEREGRPIYFSLEEVRT